MNCTLLQDLRTLLEQWSSGVIDAQKVHEEAERLWENNELSLEYPRDNPKSIAIEVLSQLEILNHQLIIPDDIPAILRFLNTSSGSEQQGWDDWTNYWESIDMSLRQKSLISNSYYCS